MSKTIKLEDLSPEQLRAQVRLCFKFMEQCLSILNGEDVKEEAAIRLVDPIGDSSDMELFYKCKQIGSAGDLADAMETIDQLNKKVEKLKKRLAKKHDEVEQLKDSDGRISYKVGFDLKEFNDQIDKACKIFADSTRLFLSQVNRDTFGNDEAYKTFKKLVDDLYTQFPKSFAAAVANKCVSVRKKESLLCACDSMRVREMLRAVPIGLVMSNLLGIPVGTPVYEEKPKFEKGQKVYYMSNNIVQQGIVDRVSKVGNEFRYFINTLHPFCYRTEGDVFSSVEDLLSSLKDKIRNGKGK